MSTRHRIAVITLLSSSLAGASPAPQPPPPPRPVEQTAHAVLAPFVDPALVRAIKHRRVSALTDNDGYPLVGNMHGKRAK
jgi:hypothetical protein